jgi:type IV secretory pathway VirB4 component
LHDYVGDGASAYLADWPTTVPDDSPLVIFDTRNISDDEAGAVMFTILEHLQNQAQLAKQHKHRGPWAGRRFLVIDEAWKMFQSVTTGRWVNEQARRSRHHRLFLIAISQAISDFTKTAEGEALVAQSSLLCFLKQKAKQARLAKEPCGLTDEAVTTISELKTVKGQYAEAYLVNGTRGAEKIQVRAGSEEYWYATSEPDHDQPLRNRVLDEHNGDSWAALEALAREHAPLAA